MYSVLFVLCFQLIIQIQAIFKVKPPAPLIKYKLGCYHLAALEITRFKISQPRMAQLTEPKQAGVIALSVAVKIVVVEVVVVVVAVVVAPTRALDAVSKEPFDT